jgi:precorrin-2/cobalt-factor-2 C20-methyltransferase
MTGKGKLYGVGIGPGDPELMTLRSVNVLKNIRNIVAPVREEGGESTALGIVSKATDLEGKNVIKLVFRMEGGRKEFEECGRYAASKVIDILRTGEDVAVITLGDPSIYSTYMYINDHIESSGFETEVIPGVTSFSAAAALAKVPLVLGDESLAVVPSAYGNRAVEAALNGFDNIVVMKAGKSTEDVADLMSAYGIPEENATVVSRAGMEGQYIGPMGKGREFNYFTTIIIRKAIK